MLKVILNTVVAALIISLSTYLFKRSSFLASLLISLPLTSIIALSFIFIDSGNIEEVSRVSKSIFWLVIPSLPFFLFLPIFLRIGISFWISISLSSAVCILIFIPYRIIISKFGIVIN